MRKTISRFLVIALVLLTAVLVGSLAMYIYQEGTSPDGSEPALNIPFIPSKKETAEEYSRIETLNLSKQTNDSDEISTHGYDSLTSDDLKKLYNALDDSVYRISEEISDDGRYKTKMIEINGADMSSADINLSINAYLYDHPQVFWIDNYFGYHSSNGVTYVECYSVLSGNQCELYIKRFNDALSEMLSDISAEDGEYDREKKLHNKLLKKCTYKKGVESLSDGWEYFSAYGALVGGEAVCEGYSKAMMLLLNLAGVDCTTIRGSGESKDSDWERHMWNLVNIGGKWYHLDSTWDDNDEDEPSYDFFNLTTDSIRIDHIPDVLISESTHLDNFDYNFFMPECKSTDMNYYYVEGVVINSLDEEAGNAITNKIYTLSQNNECYVHILIGDNVEYDDFMNLMFNNGGNQFYDYIERVNSYLGEEHFSTKRCRLVENPKKKTLRVRLLDPE